jgi:hypothetical protein
VAVPKGIFLPPPPQIGVDCPPVMDDFLPIVGAAWVPFPALTAVPGARDMSLYTAICRSLERKLLIFLGLGFFFELRVEWARNRCSASPGWRVDKNFSAPPSVPHY